MTHTLKNRSGGDNKMRLSMCRNGNRERQMTKTGDRTCLT